MKNTKKFLLGVFAMSALMLGACSGGQKPAPSSSTEPAPSASSSQATSSEPEASTSVAPESSSVNPESSASDPEPSSSEEEVTEHTVELDEAPTEGRVVVAHGWKGTDDIITAAAEVEGANVTFDLQTNDLDGYLIAELKEGKTFTDFVLPDSEDATERDWTVVERKTNTITDMSATEASWEVTEMTVTIDEAPGEGHTVVVWGWEGAPDWTNHEAVATVTGTTIAFDFQGVEVVGADVVELKEGYTTLKDAEGKWNDDAVLRRSNDFVPGTDTTVDWKVVTTEEVDFSVDTSASALASRTIFVQSWDSTGGYTGYVSEGKVAILKNAVGFLVAVLNEGQTEPNSTWSNLKKTKDYTEIPETSITLYLSGDTLLAGVDGDDPTTAEVTYNLVGTIGGENKWAFADGVTLVANTSQEGEYMLEDTITLSVGDELKITDSNGTWYPSGSGNNWAITVAGEYQIYFRPAGHTAEGWNGYFTVVIDA